MTSYIRVLIIFTILKIRMLTASQLSNPVSSLENNHVRLTFNIPLARQERIIPVRLDPGEGQTTQDVLFINVSNLSVRFVDTYVGRLNVTSSLAERKIYVHMKGASAADAGMYRCYDGIDYKVLANCGQQLVIVRKPKKPTIQELSSALEGADLKLACVTSSTSMPVDHGLKSAILWRNEFNQTIGVPGTEKLSVDADGHLEIRNVQRSDKGLKLTCSSSDVADGITSSPESEQSETYEVQFGLKPTTIDIVLTPADNQISKRESEDLTYTCDTTCHPACAVQWSFKSFNSSSFSPLLAAGHKALNKKVTRNDSGTYRCSASNKHGLANKEFELQVIYISPPALGINDRMEDNTTVLENQPVKFQCVGEALPAPKMSWKFNNVLSDETGRYPKVLSRGNASQNVYTSVYSINSVQCEDTGVYSCEVTNEVNTFEGRINMVVLCPPTRADIDGLRLEHEYFWETSKSLNFSFVIKAFPEPNVVKVWSKVNDTLRIEDMTQDVSITKHGTFDGRDYLRKFTFTSARNLDLRDEDIIFTMTFNTSEFERDLDFVVRPQGPPQPVTNITAVNIKHSSLRLLWIAGFNGGQTQHFDIEYRNVRSNTSPEWYVAANDIKDALVPNIWMEQTIPYLETNTEYMFRVKSTNSLGSVYSEVCRIHTAAEYLQRALSISDIGGVVAAVTMTCVAALILVIFIHFIKRRNMRSDSNEHHHMNSEHQQPINGEHHQPINGEHHQDMNIEHQQHKNSEQNHRIT